MEGAWSFALRSAVLPAHLTVLHDAMLGRYAGDRVIAGRGRQQTAAQVSAGVEGACHSAVEPSMSAEPGIASTSSPNAEGAPRHRSVDACPLIDLHAASPSLGQARAE